jgi:uncharacterized membrane protein YbaN (DUF454 family)
LTHGNIIYIFAIIKSQIKYGISTKLYKTTLGLLEKEKITINKLPGSKERVKSRKRHNKILRYLYVLGGTIALGLAVLGVIVPGLPSTPFALLSAYLYAKGSRRLYIYLLRSKTFGPKIKNYQRRKGIPKRGKINILVFMTAMVLLSAFVFIDEIKLRILVLVLGLIGFLTVSFIVPTYKENDEI